MVSSLCNPHGFSPLLSDPHVPSCFLWHRYDASQPAALTNLELPYADIAIPSIVNVSGANFAPTGGGRLTCRFRSAASDPVEHATNASFYSTQLVRCAAPARNEAGVGDVSEYVAVRVSHNGDAAVSTNALPLLYMDTSSPPIISSIVPIFGPVHEPTRVTITGWNLAPTRSHLKCRFGRAPLTRGGWRTNATVECVAPPASYQLVLAAGQSDVAGIDARDGKGTVPARLSIVDGYNASNVSNGEYYTDDTGVLRQGAAAFVYYVPEEPPDIREIKTPTWRGGTPISGISSEPGGELIRLIGSNIAPTSDLACRFAPRDVHGGGALLSAGGGVVVPATFVTSEEMRCLTPAAGLVGSFNTVVFATHNATAAAEGDGGYAFGASVGGQWSTRELRVTYVNTNFPAQLLGVVPPFSPVLGGSLLVVSGTNFAPTDELACYFTFAAFLATEDTRMPASFISGDEVRCFSPMVPGDAAPHDAILAVRLSNGGPSPDAPLQFTYYDPCVYHRSRSLHLCLLPQPASSCLPCPAFSRLLAPLTPDVNRSFSRLLAPLTPDVNRSHLVLPGARPHRSPSPRPTSPTPPSSAAAWTSTARPPSPTSAASSSTAPTSPRRAPASCYVCTQTRARAACVMARLRAWHSTPLLRRATRRRGRVGSASAMRTSCIVHRLLPPVSHHHTTRHALFHHPMSMC